MTDSHEQYILLRLAKGDKEAFAAVFDKYYGKVFTFVRSMVRQRAVAEDITQDLFVKLWEKRRRLSRISSLDDYLFIAARNRVIDYFRSASHKKNTALSEDLLLTLASHEAEARLDNKSDVSAVRNATRNLPPKRRDIFVMSRFDGLTNDEIAKIMGITRKTVENQLSLADKQIKKLQN